MSTPDYEAQAKAREAAEDEARSIEKDVQKLQGTETLTGEEASKRGEELEETQAKAVHETAAKATDVDLPPAGQSGTAQPLEDQPAAKNQGNAKRKS